MNMTAGLKPCPFCGASKAATFQDNITHTVFCDGCHASSATEFSQEDAIANWNTRTPEASDTLEMVVERDEFMAGYLIAVANIMNLHGEDVIAEDVLLQAGVNRAVLNGLDLCDYDLGPLNKLFDEIERKEALAKAGVA